MESMNNLNRKLLILVLFLFVAVISGCNSLGGGNSNPGYTKYYQGYEGITMEFADESPPNYFVFDSEGDNEIPITVIVKNEGASDSYGALFVHGYDPSIIELAGGRYPNGNNVNYYLNNNGISFTGSNTYFGLSATPSAGGRTNIGATVGFTGPNGQTYGGSVFSSNGQLKGVSIQISTGRIGYGLASHALQTFSQNFGWRAILALEGDTELTPGGGMEVYEFPALIYAYSLPESLEQFTQPIWVTACFDYATRATAMMCIDPHPTSATKKACTARSVSMSGGQGAPVSITRIDQQVSSKKVIFTIYVHNNKLSPYDEVLDYFSLYKCNPESGAIMKTTDKNVVYVGFIRLSKQDLQCIPSDNKVRLDSSGNGQIKCTAYLDYQGNSESAYEAPLQIELWYAYSKSIYRNVIIKKA